MSVRIFLLGLLLLSAAPEDAPSPPAWPPEPFRQAVVEEIPIGEDAREAAWSLYSVRCASCHGDDGRGDGPLAPALEVPPRDFTSHDWQDTVTHGWIERIILEGGPSVGRSDLMPSNPDLRARPEVVVALRDIVCDLGRPLPAGGR